MILRNWLLQRAAATPAAPALESPEETLDFVQLAHRARCGASWVMATGPGDAAPLAMLLPGGAGFACWFHALALTGRPVMPLNSRLTAAELARQLADVGVDWLLAAPDDARVSELAVRVPGLRIHTMPQRLPAAAASLPGDTVDADATLAVLFTSGTGGRARGACLSWANFAASAKAAAERLGPAVSGRWLVCMPLFHVGGLSMLTRNVLLGGPLRLLPRFEVAAVSDALDAGDIAAVSLVPTMLSRLLAHRGKRPAPAGLRVLLLGGAAAAPELLTRALGAGWPVCPTYGLTEATSQVATVAPGDRAAAQAAALAPLPGVELRILAEGREVQPGVVGEITVRGPTVMRGYFNDPAATARVLSDGWLHTGDLGLMDADGRLQVLERRDDLIVSGGENVYPTEVEAVLLQHPAVADAGVAGLPDADLGARVVAWIVREPGAAADPADLMRFCRERLAGYKLPREFVFVESLPRNAAGKLERRQLPVTGVSRGGRQPIG